jgi:hypothetical protein
MEFLFAIPILFIPVMFPVIAGCMAKCFGRKFWLWFWISVPLPFISLLIMIILPDKSKQPGQSLVYESDEFGMY